MNEICWQSGEGSKTKSDLLWSVLSCAARQWSLSSTSFPIYLSYWGCRVNFHSPFFSFRKAKRLILKMIKTVAHPGELNRERKLKNRNTIDEKHPSHCKPLKYLNRSKTSSAHSADFSNRRHTWTYGLQHSFEEQEEGDFNTISDSGFFSSSGVLRWVTECRKFDTGWSKIWTPLPSRAKKKRFYENLTNAFSKTNFKNIILRFCIILTHFWP